MGNKKKLIYDHQTIYSGWSTLSKYVVDHSPTAEKPVRVAREIYDSGDGATALLYNLEKRTIILIRQFRLAAYVNGHPDGMMIETCAGMLDEDDPETTVIKEIYEETGYEVPVVEYLFTAFATPGAHKEKVSYFIAPYSTELKTGPGGGLDSEHEEIEVLEMTIEEAQNMIFSGRIQDAKTIILIQYALLHLF